jgi:hypothetical protein
VPAHLAADRGHGEREEVAAPLGLEAVHGVNQADGGHLNQVIQRLSSVGEPARDVLGDRQIAGDQPFPELLPAGIRDVQVGVLVQQRHQVVVLAVARALGAVLRLAGRGRG